MNTIYPLKFKPLFKEKIWGGQRLKLYADALHNDLFQCGEAWLLSGLDSEESIVTNGFLKDNSLQELVEVYMEDLLGERVFEEYGSEFPLLFKIIDTNDYLSLQVHPDNEMARKFHNSFGKTEMWYVLHAEPDAQLYSGFTKLVTKPQFLEHLKQKTITDILNVEKVQRGDVLYLPAGRIHAIGPGIVLAEIQQSSDITYRLYDWDRLAVDGRPRELHLEQGVGAIDFDAFGSNKIQVRPTKNIRTSLIENNFFTVNIFEADKILTMENNAMETFSAHLCIDGSYKVSYAEGEVVVDKGEALLIPACVEEYKIIPLHHCAFLETYITSKSK